jgi:imidazolonepropionase-like amidohydrolase
MIIPTPTHARAGWTAFVAACCAAALTACSPGAGTTAYVGATVWDGTDSSPVDDAVILEKEGRIERVGPAADVSIPRGATEVRLDGKWVMPGLVDAHAHVQSWMLPRLLAYGVTSIRDVGGVLDSVVVLRDDVGLGSTLGPRMYIAGAMVDGSPATWPEAIAVTSSTEARQAVDRLMLLGVSHVKVYTRIDEPLLRAILDEAATFELPVTAHLGKVDAVTAARLGLTAVEHLTGIVEATVDHPELYFRAHDDFFVGWNQTERTWPMLDSAAIERTVAALVGASTTIVPTLVLHEAYSRLTDRAYVSALDLRGVPDSIQSSWNIPDLVRRARLTADEFRAFRRSRPYQDRFVRFYRRAGGRVAAGTDTPNQLLAPGASLHDELLLLVRAGLTPKEALLAATRESAALVRADSIGVIRAGGVADFLVLNADPLTDIRHTRDIQWIVFRGILYSPENLMERARLAFP